MEATFQNLPDYSSLAVDELNPLTDPDGVVKLTSALVSSAAGEVVLDSIRAFILGSDSHLLIKRTFELQNLAPSPQSWSSGSDHSWFLGGCTALSVLALAGLRHISYKCENEGQLFTNLTP